MHASLRPRRPARHAGAALAASVVLAAVLAPGCSTVPQRDVLARVGDQIITAEEFRATARDMASQFPLPPDSAKKVLLGEMVKRQLLIAEGRRLGYERDTAATAAERRNEDGRITRALIERLAPREVGVSEGEVVELHRWRSQQTHMFLLYASSRAAADAAMTGLRARQSFAEVSARFGAPGVVPPGGDLGWVVAGQLVDPLDTVARTAPVGVPQGPLRAPTVGWFVAVVEERRQRPVGPLDSERPLLTDMLRQRKQRSAAMVAFQSLREQYQVEVEPRGAQIMHLISTTPGGRPEHLAETEPLATYDGGPGARGVYRVADAWSDLADPQTPAPQPSSTEALEAWIDGQAVVRVALIEARRRHLDEEPAAARARRLDHEDLILQRVYYDIVARVVAVSDEEARLFAAGALSNEGSPGMSAATPEGFALLPEALQQNLRQAALQRKREERLRAVTDELALRTKPFEVHPERLAGVAWPAMQLQDMPGLPPAHPR